MHSRLQTRLSASIVFFLVFVLASAALCEETVRINGTGAGLVVMKPLIKAFRKSHPNVRFEMERSLGSAAALKAVMAGAIDIAVAGRPLKPEEAQRLQASEYGKIPYAVTTHRGVKVKNVTTSELAAMYSGKQAAWPDGEFVRVVLRPLEDADTKILRTLSPEMDAATTAAHARKDMVMGITDQEAFENIKKIHGAVCFTPLAMALSEPGSVNVADFNGVAPTVSNLASGKYPHFKSISIVLREGAPAAAKEFAAFINSGKGTAIARKAGLLTARGK